MRRDLGEGEVIGVADLDHAAILDPIRFQIALAKHGPTEVAGTGRVRDSVLAEMDAVFAGDQPQMRHRGQIVLARVGDYPGIEKVQLRIGIIEFQDLQGPLLVEHRKRRLARFLLRPLGHPQQQPDLAIEAEYARIQ